MSALSVKTNTRLPLVLLILGLGSLGAWAEEVKAYWRLESNQGWTGQALVLQIQIQGVDSFEPPRLAVSDVQIHWLGGAPSNSTSVTSINGKTTTTVRRSFTGQWSLSAQKPGRYHIDPLRLQISGTLVTLPALDWQVSQAPASSLYRLEQSLNPPSTVPGMALDYTLTWYIRGPVQDPSLNLPILDLDSLDLDPASLEAPQGQDVIALAYGAYRLPAIRDKASIQGQDWTTLTIKLRLTPRHAGTFDLSGTSVVFQGAETTRTTQDFFGQVVQEPDYRIFQARAQDLQLQVRDFPLVGRPQAFSGLVGDLKLEWTWEKRDYRQGEPIRLGLGLRGVQNHKNPDLAAMVSQALEDPRWTLVPDPSPREDSPDDLSQWFILRARQAGRLVLPPLSLNYFDPGKGEYRTALSPPLVIQIQGFSKPQTPQDTRANGDDTQAGVDRVEAKASGPSQAGVYPPHGLATDPGFPWFDLTCLVFGFLGCLATVLGWWHHSQIRRRLIDLDQWLLLLSPLTDREGQSGLPQDMIDQVRLRLDALCQPPASLASDLETSGCLSRLRAQAREWDQLYFAGRASGEDWPRLWAELAGQIKTRWSRWSRRPKAWPWLRMVPGLILLLGIGLATLPTSPALAAQDSTTVGADGAELADQVNRLAQSHFDQAMDLREQISADVSSTQVPAEAESPDTLARQGFHAAALLWESLTQDNWRYHYAAACARWWEGRLPLAIWHYRAYLGQDPWNPVVWENLKQARQDAGTLDPGGEGPQGWPWPILLGRGGLFLASLALVFLGYWAWFRRAWARNTALGLAGLGALALISLVFLPHIQTPLAVMIREQTGYQGDASAYAPRPALPWKAGQEVWVRETRNQWVKIEVSGQESWVPADSLDYPVAGGKSTPKGPPGPSNPSQTVGG